MLSMDEVILDVSAFKEAISLVVSKELLLYNAPNSSSLAERDAISLRAFSATSKASIACLILEEAARQLSDLAFKLFANACRYPSLILPVVSFCKDS